MLRCMVCLCAPTPQAVGLLVTLEAELAHFTHQECATVPSRMFTYPQTNLLRLLSLPSCESAFRAKACLPRKPQNVNGQSGDS